MALVYIVALTQCCRQLSFVTMGGSDMLMQGVTCVSMQRQPQRMLKDIKRWYVTCHQCPLSSEGFRGAVKHYANTYLPTKLDFTQYTRNQPSSMARKSAYARPSACVDTCPSCSSTHPAWTEISTWPLVHLSQKVSRVGYTV